MTETHSIQTIRPATVRYIKLGEGGGWFDECIAKGELRFSDRVPHELAVRGDWDAARTAYVAGGDKRPSDSVRELRAFYELGPDCLWITQGTGRLWWAFASAEVVEDPGTGQRRRRALDGWRSTDIGGEPLLWADLSTLLTKVAGYRRTICSVTSEAEAYLLRRLNRSPDDQLIAAEDARTALLANTATLVAGMHWSDFELLVDLIFAGSGWRRISAIGGAAQADSDLILEQAVTGERAMVQVKSHGGLAIYRDYLERFRAQPDVSRFFFVCHSFQGAPPAPEPGIHVWLGSEVAEQALRAGLLDWLLRKRR